MIKIVKILGLAATVWSASKAMDDGNDISKMQDKLQGTATNNACWLGGKVSNEIKTFCGLIPSFGNHLEKMQKEIAENPSLIREANKKALEIAQQTRLSSTTPPNYTSTWDTKKKAYIHELNDEQKREWGTTVAQVGMLVFKDYEECLKNNSIPTAHCDARSSLIASQLGKQIKNTFGNQD